MWKKSFGSYTRNLVSLRDIMLSEKLPVHRKQSIKVCFDTCLLIMLAKRMESYFHEKVCSVSMNFFKLT